MNNAPPDTPTICPANSAEWRQWLQENHGTHTGVWLVYLKKSAGHTRLSWSHAVDEALCFGWIDSKAKRVDDDRYIQFFCRRKPKSGWSKINKEKINLLIENGKMTEAGLRAIETAKQNGAWQLLDEVEAHVVPPDLAAALAQYPGAQAYFLGLSPSVRRSILQWLVLAKRPETRQKRIAEVANEAANGQRPKPFR